MTSQEVNAAIRESLGLPQVVESKPTVPIEGHVCDFPLWSFSKQRSSETRLHINYEYLDVILFYGQRDLFLQDHTSLSVYRILQTLGMDPTNGMNYEYFRRDMRRAFYMGIETDRFRHPSTRQRSHVAYLRVLRQMFVAKNRREVSTFYFDDLFIASLRAGYLKRLDWEYCLELDRQGEALARFLYGHLTKRIGEKSLYMRKIPGFLSDIGLGYLTKGEPKRVNETLKRTVYPALDHLRWITYRLDDHDNLVFASTYPQD